MGESACIVGAVIGECISCCDELVLDPVDPLDSKVYCVYSGHLCICTVWYTASKLSSCTYIH